MQHVFSSAVSEVALTVHPGFLPVCESFQKQCQMHANHIKRQHVQKGSEKAGKPYLERTLTRPEKCTNKHATCLPFSVYRSFNARAKFRQTASNNVISTGTNGSLFSGVGGRGGSPLMHSTASVLSCLVLYSYCRHMSVEHMFWQ